MKIQNLLILLFFLSSLVVETLAASETFPIKPGGSSHVKVSEVINFCGQFDELFCFRDQLPVVLRFQPMEVLQKIGS